MPAPELPTFEDEGVDWVTTEQPSPDDAKQDTSGLGERVRHGQSDLDDAISLLRSLDMSGLPPAATFDPNWPEASS